MTSPIFDIAGRTVLITGSSRGIGFALAEGMGAAGATVVLNGRSETSLASARAALAEKELSAHTAQFDVTDEDAVSREIDRLETDVGPIDVLINNAGIQHRAALEDFPHETWRELFRTHLDGAFLVSRAVARHMIGRERGKIINICSVNSELARTTIAPYAAAKGGLKMLTRGMCADWAKHNIQVNGIGPGYFKTELNEALFSDPQFRDWLVARTPAKRWGELGELVGAAIFLASPASSFVNGHILYVDGGITAAL